MLYVIKWLYAWILPLGGIMLALAALVIYMMKKKAPGRGALMAIFFVLYLLSIQPLSEALVQSLEKQYGQPQAVHGDVIVLLGGGAYAGVPDLDGLGQVGGSAANRFLTAVRLQRQTGLPLVLSGGAVFDADANEAAIERRLALSMGVPAAQIYVEDRSRNTAENAYYTHALCDEQGWQQPIVVTSAFHMPRAMLLFEREGMAATACTSDYRTNSTNRISAYSVIPSAYALQNSCMAIKEYAGMAAIRCGWQ